MQLTGEVGPFFIANGNEYNYIIDDSGYLAGSYALSWHIMSTVFTVNPTTLSIAWHGKEMDEMTTSEGAQLAQIIRQKVDEFKQVCQGIDESRAGRAPEGRWSPKQIVSHLCGPEGTGFMPTVRAILEQDTPQLDIEVENPFFAGKRTSMTLAELLSEFEGEYGRLAEVAEGLNLEQLERKAHIQILKETPLGEYPTLAGWISALSEYHLGSHIEHMKEVLKEMG